MSMLFVEAQKSVEISNKKPNIIVVLADDIGVGDISKYRRLHSDNIILETPNIDSLADAGMMFTDAHAPAALCATTRYAIMTGNSCYRSSEPWGVWSGYAKSVIKDDQMTLGKLMKQANYNTAFFGKWHIGTSFAKKGVPEKIYEPKIGKAPVLDIDITKILHGPTQLGFDYSVTLPAGIQSVPYAVYENDQWLKLKEDSKIEIIDAEYLAKLNLKLDKAIGYGDSNWDPHNIGTILANKAVDYITKNANKEKPFFMYYCSQAVHVPHAPASTLDGVNIKGTTPSLHMDMIKELDVQMGMMVNTLKQQGIYDNTVFIFTSDNGGLLGDKKTAKSGHKVSDIYRGAKNQAYEGGHRVPFIVSWPDEIKPNQMSDNPILGLDIMATIAAISNQKLSNNVAQDSYNLLPVLKNEKQATTHPFLMVQGGSQHEFILIDNGWKLILQVDKKDKTNKTSTPVALFNLNDNVEEEESKNYIKNPNYQKKIQELYNKYNQTRESLVFTGSHF
ncbi:arylsulfatase [Tamlana fucoidanivorans]|uniref:Arylsulfatase n=2 Tax=Allotamlana fucoidanivorans TaxID=2583814 RepID=A0A5C4SJ36_9FLAO|nr:arylsulfatase [Tamlana fucoidanivorans]